MAKWRAGAERAYVALPNPADPRERITRLYKEGDVFDLPDDMLPSRTWRPMDEKAVAICKRIVKEKHLKAPPPEPEDPWDERQARKYASLNSRWAMEQAAQNTWFGTDTYQAQGNVPDTTTLTEMARSQGKSVRASDQQI